MDKPDKIESLLFSIFELTARRSVPMAEIQQVVGDRPNQVKAYNLCDGKRTLAEVAQRTGVASSNLSRTVKRWVKAGVAYWIGSGRDARLLHLYALPMPRKRR